MLHTKLFEILSYSMLAIAVNSVQLCRKIAADFGKAVGLYLPCPSTIFKLPTPGV